MKVHSSHMGVGGWYDALAAGWLADMMSKQANTSPARRLESLAALIRPLAGAEGAGAPAQAEAGAEEEDRSGSPLGPGGPYSCSQCRGAYPTREQLERHETLHTPSTQTCQICHKSFANVYRLQRHKISHDESAQLRKYKCNDCDKAFKFKHHLKEHLRIHSGEKPFECANCGKKFSHSGSYSSHMTSKKCLVMNIKMGRIKPNNPALNPDRSPSRKRSSAMAQQLNNNIAQNGNSFLPILPKYNGGTPFFDNNFPHYQLGQPGMNPFYMPPGMSPNPGITPYTPIYPPTLNSPLRHIFEQLASTHFQQRKLESPAGSKQTSPVPADPEDMIEEVHEDDDKRSEGSAELVMDIEEEEASMIKKEKEELYNDFRPPARNCESVPTNNNGSESVGEHANFNTILESVSASVTKHFLRTNMQKMSPISGNVCPNLESPPALSLPIKDEPVDEYRCGKCDATFNSRIGLLDHEKIMCGNIFRKHEGLAAQMAETVALTRLEAEMRASIQSGVSASEDEDFSREDRDDKTHDSDRKIRVRTSISEDQQSILKEHYAINARPNREQFKKIAYQLGLDNRVIQVWFQNNRARERRMSQSVVVSDQPLDLSTKRSDPSVTSSPAPSPPYSASATHSDSEEAVNLSQKSSRSTTPHRSHMNQFNTYPHSNCSSSSYTEYRHSPSPGELNQKRLHQKLSPVTPMERILQYNDLIKAARSPLGLGMHLPDLSRQSPGYDRPWTDKRDFDLDDVPVLKKSKVKMEAKEGDGQYVCDQCDKTFVKQSSLARHKYEHSGQRPYRCVECPKAFKHKHHLTEHKRLHTGEKPFECKKCHKKFSHSGSFSQHMNHRFAICKPYRP